MSAEPNRIGQAWKAIGAVFAAAVAVSQYLLWSRNDQTPIHFAVFLVGQTWLEVLVIGGVWVLYAVAKSVVNRIKTATAGQRTSWTLAQFSSIRVLAPLVSCIALALLTINNLLYLARARHYFWTESGRKAYVYYYTPTIDMLADSGRVTDAANLTDLVVSTLGNNSEGELLARRRRLLQGAVRRSNDLARADIQSEWNAVGDRMSYFRLLEAVRLNPENYLAADILKRRIALLSNYLTKDAASICSARGNFGHFKGFATSYIEAVVRWSDYVSIQSCGTGQEQKAIIEAWRLQAAQCYVDISDSTKKPFSPDSSSVELSHCSRMSDYKPFTAELEDARDTEDDNWYDFVESPWSLISKKITELRGKAKDAVDVPDTQNVSPTGNDEQAEDKKLIGSEDIAPPIAFARVDNSILLVNKDGLFMQLGATKYSFPVIVGLSRQQSTELRAQKISQYVMFMRGMGMTWGAYVGLIESVDVSNDHDLTMSLSHGSGRVLIHLGDSLQVERFGVYTKYIAKWEQQFPELNSVDLSQDSQIVINGDPVH
jgi:hypothetical protein